MKIATCTPYHSQVHAQFTTSVMAMIAHTNASTIIFNGVATKPELKVFMTSGSMLSLTRNRLLRDALEWDANYLLWLDADHVFPADTLMRLLGHNLPLVGANYPRRVTPTFPTAAALDGSHLWTTKELADAGAIEEVRRLGMGVCLMDVTILGAVLEAAQAEGRKTIWPMFSEEPIPDSLEGKGEDTFFFERLRNAGVKTYVDHALSWEVGHFHEITLWNSDAVAQKEDFARSRRAALERGQ